MKEQLFSTHHALEARHWWFRGRRRAILELGTRLLPERGVVVDVGCGTGADIGAFPERHDRHGIDSSPTAIQLARRAHPGVSFETGAAPEAGREMIGRADLVLLCDVLEHVEHDHAFLERLIGSMRPEAHLLMTVPFGPWLWSPHDEVYGHYRRYTREMLWDAWSGVPAEVRLLAPFNRRLYPLARMVRRLGAWRGSGTGREGSDMGLPWAPVNRALERVFTGEVPGLVDALKRGRRDLPGHGLSLLAILRRSQADGE